MMLLEDVTTGQITICNETNNSEDLSLRIYTRTLQYTTVSMN